MISVIIDHPDHPDHHFSPMINEFINSPWVEEQLEQLSLRKRIAQLIHVPAWSNRGEAHFQELMALVREYEIGGITFFQGTQELQMDMTQRLQAAAAIPLMVSIDAEWGLAMRLDGGGAMPYAMTLGEADDPKLTETLAADLARQAKGIGVHVNFAPSVDLNTEPSNPVIGFRSFGTDKTIVVAQADAYVRGMQGEGVMAVAKHFPGHGDTHQDSHLTLPQLPHSLERLQEVEMAPFAALAKTNIGGMMTAHLQVDALDNTPVTPATLSPKIIRGWLREKLGFEGMIFTDALDMKGIAAHYSMAEATMMALKAGNDAMVFCTDVPGSIDLIEAAVANGEISEDIINQACRRTLAAKQWLGLDRPQQQYRVVPPSPQWEAAIQSVYHKALKPLGGATPVQSGEKVAVLPLHLSPLEDGLKHHQLTRSGAPGVNPEEAYYQSLPNAEVLNSIENVGTYDRLLVSLHGLSPKAGLKYGLTSEMIAQVRELALLENATLILFGRKEALGLIFEGEVPCPVLIAWQDTREAHHAVGEWVGKD